MSAETCQTELLENLGAYVRYVADVMRLKDWSFDVALDPHAHVKGDYLAAIEVSYRRRYAVITFGELFLEADPEDQRHAVVHELAHPHLQGLRDHIQTLDGQLVAGTFAMFRAGHDQQIETAADEFAAMVAPQVLTPEEWGRLNQRACRQEQERPRGRDVRAPERPDRVSGSQQAVRIRRGR